MPFTIIDNPTFKWTARPQVPVEGGHEEQPFTVHFRVLPEQEAKKHDASGAGGVRAFLAAAILGFEDLVDEAGKPVAYSSAVRDRLLNLPYVRVALLRAYSDGVSKAPEGN